LTLGFYHAMMNL